MIIVDCVDVNLALYALLYSSRGIECEKSKLFSDILPNNLPENVEFIKISKINSLDEYSKFMVNVLPDYIDTEYCLVVQSDGIIINPNLWNNNFFKYDYIGAPWTPDSFFLTQGVRVGNGGVSLRTLKLMKFAQSFKCRGAEDVFLCVELKKQCDDLGIKFAPVELAKVFSCEIPCQEHDSMDIETDCFAIHGKYHTPLHMRLLGNMRAEYSLDML